MTASAVCPKCGGPLPATAPEGLCPRCLLRSVLRKPPPLRPAKGPPPILGVHIRVGDYELLHEIGRGGMGVVYKARQAKLNRLVAIKLMPLGRLAGEQAKQRVRNEAQAAARLQHPNIVAVYDVGEHEGAPFICMEYVEGQNLEKVAGERSLKPNEVVELVRALAIAVQYAHEHGVIHRDLKPSNVMLDTAGRPRVMDFGLARHLGSDVGLTASGQALGTPSFMSPEQAGGERRLIGAGTDVYSLGGILYFLLTGRPPFVADSRDEVISQVLRADPVALRRLNASVPSDLQTICLKCLDKNPGRRYQTAEDLAEDLGRFLRKEPIRAKPAGVGTKMWRWCQRQPLAASLLGGLLLVSAFAVLSLFVGFVMAVAGWSAAERSASEQKRLREIAEEAVRGLEGQSSSSYKTSGVFRFKVPQGFIPMTGERLAVLKQAILRNLTVQESKDEVGAMRGALKEGVRRGVDYARQSGIVAPGGSEDDMQMDCFYQSADGSRLLGFTTTVNPESLRFEDMEMASKGRLRWQIEHSLLDKDSSVTSESLFGGWKTVVVRAYARSKGCSFRSYIVSTEAESLRFHGLWILQMGNGAERQDEEWISDFLGSVRVVVPE